MKEVWTKEAKSSFTNNIKYLKNHWTINEVLTFKQESFKCIDRLLKNPRIGIYDEVWGCYKFLIVKQIFLFYEIHENNLVLISFWNNYQKPIGQLS